MLLFDLYFVPDGVVTTPGVALDDFEIIGPSNIPLPVTMGSFTGKAEENELVGMDNTQ